MAEALSRAAKARSREAADSDGGLGAHTMSSHRIAALAALLTAAGVVAAVLLAGGSPAKPSPSGEVSGSGAATVERRDLVETDTEAGTLSYADPQTVYDRLGGTITWLPRAGQLIRPGGVLFAVDGGPVVLLDGATPAFRALGPGTGAGPDVLELNRNLVALGFDPDAIAIDDEWQAATTAGVEALQLSLGETGTGTLALGRVVFLPGAQLVSGVDATLGGDGGGSGTGSPSSTGASDPSGAGAREYASSTTTATTPPAAASPGPAGRSHSSSPSSVRRLEAQLRRLQAEVTRLRARDAGARTPNGGSPQSSGSPTAAGSPSGSGSPGTAGSPSEPGGTSPVAVLQTTSTRLVVTVALEASKQREARRGAAVTVALPDGETADGTITAVSAVAQSAPSSTANGGTGGNGNGSGGSGSTVPVTISLRGRHAGAGLDQAAVSVNFAEAVARNVLSVPVTALLATGGGSYAVQEAAPPHRLMAVTTGLFAAGDVQISGPGIQPGLQVSDAQG